MKRIAFVLFTVLLLTDTLSVSAQYRPYRRPAQTGRPSYMTRPYGYSRMDRYSDVYYGLRLGFGVSTVNSDSKVLDTNKSKTGLNVGFVIGVPLSDQAPIAFESGLYYTEKGGKSTYNGGKFTYNLDYLEVPLVLKYSFYTGEGFAIQPFAGGYLACGVAGKIKDYENREAYGSFSGDDDDSFNRFDGGIRLGCGASFQMLYLEACYDIGLANIGKDQFDDTRNGCFYLNFGVNF